MDGWNLDYDLWEVTSPIVFTSVPYVLDEESPVEEYVWKTLHGDA